MSQDASRSRNRDNSVGPVSTDYAWPTTGLDGATVEYGTECFSFALVKLFKAERCSNVDSDLVLRVEGDILSGFSVASGRWNRSHRREKSMVDGRLW